ncbi:hypothetical protein E2C01_061137 [Portunus trituberculatus]|uniref:Uncharacterized protein n=1 Tax=Portunus trituberculatus TaxID=210409 RepID=A0A5B7HCE3_PORTR|nr:hypothetical protein [Portunus trituberculatus]
MGIRMRNIKKRRRLETKKQMYRWETAGLLILASPLHHSCYLPPSPKDLQDPASPLASLPGFSTNSLYIIRLL